MNRKETTEFLGRLLKKERFGGIGKYWASEVSIDPWSTKGKGKRVDYMQFFRTINVLYQHWKKGFSYATR